MKKAISTLACNGWTLEESIAECVKNGISGMEIRMGIHDWSSLSLPDKEFTKIFHEILRAGLLVTDLGTGVVVADYSVAAMEEIERCAQAAVLLRCTGLRIMLGNFYTLRSEPRKPLNRHGIIRWLKEASLLMEKYGTEIWIETHNEFATGKELDSLLKEVNCSNIRLIWDIMHPLEAGEQLCESFQYIRPHLAHVHIKDGCPWPDGDMENYQYTRIGQGVIDIKKAVTMLRESGYQGYYSLEWEGIWRREIQGEGYSPKDAIAMFSRLMDGIETE